MIRDYRARGVFNFVSVGADKTFESINSELKDKPYQITPTR